MGDSSKNHGAGRYSRQITGGSCILQARVLAVLLLAFAAQTLTSCDAFSPDEPSADWDFPLHRWPSDAFVTAQGYSESEESVVRRFDLTKLHGEREFTRNARFVDIEGDGDYEILSRTMNENQVRALDAASGRTIWVSPRVLPAAEHPQASQLAVGDLDEDGIVEAVVVSYDGHVLCIDGRDGSIQWQRELDYNINNPLLELEQITDDPGLELALTVSRKVNWTGYDRWNRGKINNVRDPSVLVLKSDGSNAWLAEHYDEKNNRGHKTWTYDIDEDGFSEVFAIGRAKVVAFDHTGERLFTLPVQENAHPDQLRVGDWGGQTSILYTDGIEAIVEAGPDGTVRRRHWLQEGLRGHLQDIVIVPSKKGPQLLAQNIRRGDAKMIAYDQQLQPRWAAELKYDAWLRHTVLLDWDGDDDSEIAVGSVSSGDGRCSAQVMETDGSLTYWRAWDDATFCWVLDAEDTDGDGTDELLLGTGKNRGNEGRWSLPGGAHMRLHILESASE